MSGCRSFFNMIPTIPVPPGVRDVRMTADFSREDLRPYFLWDEDLSIAEVKVRLRGEDEEERNRLLTRSCEKPATPMSGTSRP